MLRVEVKVRSSHTILRTHTQEREGGGGGKKKKGNNEIRTHVHTLSWEIIIRKREGHQYLIEKHLIFQTPMNSYEISCL